MKKAMDRKSTTKTLLLMCMVRLGLGYKIRRSDCWINDTMDYMMHCTCGGIGDPFSIILNKGPKPELGVPYYGTRFGHNLAEQIKQTMVDLNISMVTELHYENCDDHPLRIKIDFEEFPLDSFFKKDLRDLREIRFSSVHSVNLYLNSALTWGNMTIKFENILNTNDFGYGKTGSIVVYGEVEYCEDPCSLVPPTAKHQEEEEEEDKCNKCDPESTLLLDFESIKEVLFHDLILTPLVTRQHGHCFVEATSVNTFRVEGGKYEGVNTIIEAEECLGWKDKVNCSDMFEIGGVTMEDEGVTGLVIAAVAVVFIFMAVVGAVLGMRGVKAGVD